MTSVGFIGLGIMGAPMAANLVKAGFDVVGYNLHPEPVQRLIEAGGRGADGIPAAVRDADVIITMVPDPGGLTTCTAVKRKQTMLRRTHFDGAERCYGRGSVRCTNYPLVGGG